MDTGQASQKPGAIAASDSSKGIQASGAQGAQGGGEQKGGDGAAPSKRRNRRGRGSKKGDESSQKAVNDEGGDGGGGPTPKSAAIASAGPQKAQGKSSSQTKQVKLPPKEARSPKASENAKAPAAAVPGSQAQTATASALTGAATASATATKKKAKKRRDRKRKEKKTGGHGLDIDDDDDIDAQQQRPKLKVVVRRLPPNLPESVFWRSVEPWIKGAGQAQQQAENAKEKVDGGVPSQTPVAADEEKADWTYFVPGKLKDGARRGAPPDARELLSHTHARAYIRFTSLDALLAFHRAFDGHVFRDEARKMDYAAIVEFAAFQKIPSDLARARGAAAAKNKNRSKADDKENTIENDADFKEFVASLQEREKTPAEKTDAQLMADIASNQAERAKSTPLLEHLRKQKAGKKQRSGGGVKGSGAPGSTAKEKKTKKQSTPAAAVTSSTSSLVPAVIKGGAAPTPPTKPAAMKDKGKDKGKAGAAPSQGKKKRGGGTGKGGKEKEKDKQGSGAGPQVAILKRPEPK